MAIKNIEIQDHEGNVYHPHTDAKVVFTSDGKTVEEKLESLKQSANNGKNVVATAIGAPLSSNDTFVEMGSKIDNLTQTFRNNLNTKGVNTTNADKMSTLIDKVGEIVNAKLVFGDGKIWWTYSRSIDYNLGTLTTYSSDTKYLGTYKVEFGWTGYSYMRNVRCKIYKQEKLSSGGYRDSIISEVINEGNYNDGTRSFEVSLKKGDRIRYEYSTSMSTSAEINVKMSIKSNIELG